MPGQMNISGPKPLTASMRIFSLFNLKWSNIGYRVWVPTNRYHRTRYAVNLAVFRGLEAAQISIPFHSAMCI